MRPPDPSATVSPTTKEGFVSTNQMSEAAPGDLVIIAARRLGAGDQVGEILVVLSGPTPHYLVRWETGHESIFYPGSDATVRRRASSRASAAS
jgi:Domain of unknown function (DUF1918)